MDLEEQRKEIDIIDNKIIKLLKKRFSLLEDIVKYKKENNLSIYQSNREEEVLNVRKNLAKVEGLSEDFIETIFIKIMEESKNIQKKYYN